jgi:hypothetical protein
MHGGENKQKGSEAGIALLAEYMLAAIRATDDLIPHARFFGHTGVRREIKSETGGNWQALRSKGE